MRYEGGFAVAFKEKGNSIFNIKKNERLKNSLAS